VINGRDHVLEYPIHGDVALIKAERGDRWGNLTYRKAARNFGPVMATAALHHRQRVRDRRTRQLDPEAVVTPGIHVSACGAHRPRATQAGGFKTAA
jgi:3-oxoadipate CoA-transferase alpha subunit